jgi:rare lipoprotein A (peptidoglycan hydrolase)
LRPHPSRIIDLSKAAMDSLGGSGVIDVKLEVLPSSQQRASLTPSQRNRIIGEDVDSSSIALVNQPYIVDKVIPVPFLTPSLVG